MFRFWYCFVLENNSLIVRGAADLVYKRIAPQISEYMGKVFEAICRQYLWKLLLDGRLIVEFTSLGRWQEHFIDRSLSTSLSPNPLNKVSDCPTGKVNRKWLPFAFHGFRFHSTESLPNAQFSRR